MIKYKLGDVTNPELDRITIIVHCCNDIGVMGGGVAAALSNKWEDVYHQYEDWYNGIEIVSKPFVLGQIQLVKVAFKPDVWVCNLIGQRDIRPFLGLPPVRYEAIREGLRRLANQLCGDARLPSDFNIVMPRMGAGLAMGDWSKVSAIINEELKDFDVTVYDLEPVIATYYEGRGWYQAAGDCGRPVKSAELLEFGGQSKP